MRRSFIEFKDKIYVYAYASAAGSNEAAGPLGDRFDFVDPDDRFGEKTWELAEAALSYCGSMLLSEAKDPNLRGAVLEKIMPPDGTDNLPYHIRDLGTIFFIQAAAEYLEFYREDK